MQKQAFETYQLWLSSPLSDPDLKAELEQISGDEAAIEDRFYRDLEFGTGGLRGVIGAGTNRWPGRLRAIATIFIKNLQIPA